MKNTVENIAIGVLIIVFGGMATCALFMLVGIIAAIGQ
jgi:vacuolar-type H+-ATPase subunit I/STV1